MNSKNINELLLDHFAVGDKAAGYLRGKIPGLVHMLEEFFMCRSDIKRIQYSERLCEYILRLTDFSDIIPLRSEVATLEIKRMIKYKKQSDHTAHTLYLFLLGIWVYDNVPKLNRSINDFIDSKKPVKMFIFQWIYASLLHDVGYLFYDFQNSSNKDSWNLFDQMFSIDFLMKYTGDLDDSNKRYLTRICKEFNENYNIQIHASQRNANFLIRQLENIPWAENLGLETKSGLDLLNSKNKKNTNISEFAYQMANTGYDGKTPVVDHGIASALMLLKYTSAWYYIIQKAKEDGKEAIISKFKYYPEVLKKHVVPACRAVAYHNVPNFKFSLESEPLLYLSVLCDELQVWDRFLSGEEHIANWISIEQCMAEDIKASIINDEFNEPMLQLLTLKTTHYDKIVKSLDARVSGWKEFLTISDLA